MAGPVPATRAEWARALLDDWGHPALADTIGTNRVGDPMRTQWDAYSIDDAIVVARAFVTVHRGRYGAMSENPLVQIAASMAMSLGDHGVNSDFERTAAPHWSPARGDWVADYDPADWAIGVPASAGALFDEFPT